jgi:hypothetical protein
VLYQSGFTHAAGRDNGHIPTVAHCGNKLFALGYSVKKVFRRNLSADNKGIAKSLFHSLCIHA